MPTGRLNSWLDALVAATPPPMRGGKQPKVLFATQASTKPPRFVMFTTGFLEETYRRFIERRLREDFGFEGTPVKLTMRLREKKRAVRPVSVHPRHWASQPGGARWGRWRWAIQQQVPASAPAATRRRSPLIRSAPLTPQIR